MRYPIKSTQSKPSSARSRKPSRPAARPLLDLRVYPFTPQGVTGVAILSESHLMIHTWPEHGYAAVDVFTCGMHTDPSKAVPVLRRHFLPERVQVMEMNRGIITEDEAVEEPEAVYAGVC